MIFSASLHAQEFAYVTDSLQLRVYSSASADSKHIQTIDSGDSVEVFASEGGFTQITTYDGTVGWVKSAFLVEDPPDKLLYFSVSEKNKELKAEVEALKGSVQVSTTNSNEVDSNKINDLQIALDKEQETNQKLQEQIAKVGDMKINSTVSSSITTPADAQIISVNKKWLFFGIPLALILAGFWMGIKIASWRMRKRLHGFQI
ncbi:MAG: TIGR04211 family SH3 domain-containing protein [Gammaproteobacteria bacterium]